MGWGGAGFHPRGVPMATTWIMPLFPAPAMQISPTVLHLPPPRRHSGCTPPSERVPRPRGWRQGVQTAGVGGLAAPGVCMEVPRACVPGREGKREEEEAAEGEPTLSPRMAIFSCLSDCYRCAHSWDKPQTNIQITRHISTNLKRTHLTGFFLKVSLEVKDFSRASRFSI